MDSALNERIKQVRELLKTVQHVAVATVNEDGTPHNSPVFAGIDGRLRICWASCPDAQHSQNIDRTGQAFITVFDSLNGGPGLYIQASPKALEESEMDATLEAFNSVRELYGKDKISPEFFASTDQRLYCAEPEKIWINVNERNEAGQIICDKRVEISLTDLAL